MGGWWDAQGAPTRRGSDRLPLMACSPDAADVEAAAGSDPRPSVGAPDMSFRCSTLASI